MSGMLLKLAPNERVLVNGLVIENCDKKTKFRIKSDNASILRLRDAIHPQDLKGPVSIAYYNAQLGVAGEIEESEAIGELKGRIDELLGAFEGTWAVENLEETRTCLEQGKLYLALRALAPVLTLESELLGGDPK